MTAFIYAAIRHRLNHPQVVVWDGCAETLAEDETVHLIAVQRSIEQFNQVEA